MNGDQGRNHLRDATEDMGEDMMTTIIDTTGETIMIIVIVVVETTAVTTTETILATVITLNIGEEGDKVMKGEDDDPPPFQLHGHVQFHLHLPPLGLLRSQDQDLGHDLSNVH
mmetsp:Transcript_30545/g.46276  ORF Transcript_30545/g.46276 Transcript_30545/m.46276 type:complete len:113 (-) Transcript_30545:423-761(-)